MKKCDDCKSHSKEWSLSAELARSNRRMFAALMVVIALWFATIIGFIWYINQYDYETVIEERTLDAVQDGNGVNIAGNGDVSYGTTSEN